MKKVGVHIELGDYERMLKAQNGCCALCGRHESEFKQDLHMDHDHKTKRVRGLLCANCNRGLGCFQDDPEVLRKATEYVRR